jgi:hypothetical protein
MKSHACIVGLSMVVVAVRHSAVSSPIVQQLASPIALVR